MCGLDWVQQTARAEQNRARQNTLAWVYKWILDFLSSRPQSVQFGSHTPSTLLPNAGAPEGCVLNRPPLHTVHPQLHYQPSLYCEVCWQHHHQMKVHIGRRSAILSDAQRTSYCLSAKARSWLLILGKKRGKDVYTCLCQWSCGGAGELSTLFLWFTITDGANSILNHSNMAYLCESFPL